MEIHISPIDYYQSGTQAIVFQTPDLSDPMPTPLTDADGEVRSLENEDFRTALRFSDLSPELQAKLREIKKRQQSPDKPPK